MKLVRGAAPKLYFPILYGWSLITVPIDSLGSMHVLIVTKVDVNKMLPYVEAFSFPRSKGL